MSYWALQFANHAPCTVRAASEAEARDLATTLLDDRVVAATEVPRPVPGMIYLNPVGREHALGKTFDH
jgi:hypothetical protein